MKLLPTLATTAAIAVPATAAGLVLALAPFPGSAVDPVTTVTRRDDHDRREHDARMARTHERHESHGRHHSRTEDARDDHGGRRDRDDRTERGDD